MWPFQIAATPVGTTSLLSVCLSFSQCAGLPSYYICLFALFSVDSLFYSTFLSKMPREEQGPSVMYVGSTQYGLHQDDMEENDNILRVIWETLSCS